MNLGANPQHGGIGHDEQPVAHAGPLAPRDEDILHQPVEGRPQHERAQGARIARTLDDGILAGRIRLQPAAHERAQMFLRDLHQSVGLLKACTGPVALLPGEKPRLLAGGGEVGLGDF